MRHLQRLTVVAFALFMISSCGGSSSGGGGGGTDLAPEGQDKSSIPITTSTIRHITPGDTWNYTATGTISNGVETIDVTGSVWVQVLSTTKQSPVTLDECLDEYAIITLTDGVEEIAITSHSYFLQDGNGSFFEYGGDGDYGDIWIDSPSDGYCMELESPLVVGNHDELSISYTDGSTEVYTYSVGAIEEVNTSLGIFDAYPISVNLTYYYPYSDDMAIMKGTSWYVPNIGTIKRMSNESYYVDGVLDLTLSYTATLASTSISY